MYIIRDIQSKTVADRDLPTLEVVATRLKDLKPGCWKSYHPYVVGTDDGHGWQPLSVASEERLADLTGLRIAATGQHSPYA